MELQASFNRRITEIQRKLKECNHECNDLKAMFSASLAQLAPATTQVSPEKEKNLVENLDSTPEAILETPQEPVQETISQPLEPSLPRPAAVQPPPIPSTISATPRPAQRAAKNPPKRKTKPTRSPRSMEKFIGENLLNKVGIGILVIGIGIFVKYAIDQDWIGQVGRVLIGVLTGGILMGVAHALRKQYKAFSSVLVGGGIATLYFSFAIAHQTYGLMDQSFTFAVLCLVTLFGVLMAVGYNRQEIGIMALLGGYATPFMVASGEGSYVSLFAYLLLLNVGAMALSWFRDWKAIRILSYGLTVLLFGSWVGYNLNSADPAIGGSIAFGAAFFTVFFGMNIAFSLKHKTKLNPVNFILLISNSAFFYITTMATLFVVAETEYMGIFTALMGVFHFLFVLPARKWVSFDPRLLQVMVGLVLTFVTAAVAIQLEGSHLTLFWAIEAMVLFLLARKTKLKILANASTLISALSVAALAIDWNNAYIQDLGSDMPAIFNGAFLTTAVAVASLLGLSVFHRKGHSNLPAQPATASVFQSLGILVLYVGLLLENVDHLLPYRNLGLLAIGVTVTTTYFLVGLHIWARVKKSVVFTQLVFVLGLIFFALLWASQATLVAPMRQDYVMGLARGDGFPYHFLIVPGLLALLGMSFVHGFKSFGKGGNNLLTWILAILLVYTFSMEIHNVLALAGVSDLHIMKVAYPILWGVLGFALVLAGMRFKARHLRLAGLSLFLLIIVKLFVYDIRSIPTGGRIAAFISLGVVLLVVSFLYQRLKRLVVEDEPQSS